MNGNRWRTVAVTIIPGLLAALGMCCVPTWRDAVWACGTQWAFSQESGPRLVLAKTGFDFGQVTAGQMLEACFILHNQGNRRLIVRPEGKSCDCAVHEEAVLIEPGQSAELVVPLDTSTIAGSPRLVRYFTTNDPRQPRFEITLQVTVVPNR